MKKIWKIGIIVFLILIIIYLILPREEVNIVTQMSEEEIKGLNRILDKYERYNLVEFNILNISFTNHYNRIEEFIKADKQIDIARADIKMPNWFKKYIVNERTIPQAVDCLILFYNPKLIKSPPETIEEFINLAQKNTIDNSGNHLDESDFNSDRIDQHGIYLPLSSGWWMSSFFGAQDKDFLNKDFDRSEFKKTAKKFKRLYQSNLFHKINREGFYNQMMKEFIKGDVAMIINGPWAIPKLREEGVNFKTTLLPKGKTGRFSPMGGQQWIMLSDRPVVKEIMDYLDSTEVANLLYKYNGTLVPNDKFLNKLKRVEDNTTAKQLSQAVKIDKQTDYQLYKFFDQEFVDYIRGKISEQELVKSWQENLD